MSILKIHWAAYGGIILLAGCGGPKVVPVSGKVTVDGKPFKDLVVTFQPLGGKGNENPGRGSSAVTDAEGKFDLVYDGTSPGAVVGKHRVQIFTQIGSEPPLADDTRESDPKAFKRVFETIPPEWNEKSEKDFVVPTGGTREANFEIEVRKPKR